MKYLHKPPSHEILSRRKRLEAFRRALVYDFGARPHGDAFTHHLRDVAAALTKMETAPWPYVHCHKPVNILCDRAFYCFPGDFDFGVFGVFSCHPVPPRQRGAVPRTRRIGRSHCDFLTAVKPFRERREGVARLGPLWSERDLRREDCDWSTIAGHWVHLAGAALASIWLISPAGADTLSTGARRPLMGRGRPRGLSEDAWFAGTTVHMVGHYFAHR